MGKFTQRGCEQWVSFMALGGIIVLGLLAIKSGGSSGMNFVLLVCSGLICFDDWRRHGTVVAFQSGAIPAAIAWVFVLPLARAIEPILDSVASMGAVVVFLVLLLILLSFLGPLACLLGSIVGVFCYNGFKYFAFVLLHFLGVACAFFLVLGFCRILLRRVEQLPNVVRLDSKRDAEEYSRQSEFFFQACEQWASKYPFSLEIKNIYRRDIAADHPAAPKSGSHSRPVHLFHGTPWESGRCILYDGFRKPSHAGMFGKGIYFADCPLKSWRYCFPSLWASQRWPEMTGRGGLILCCLVELGEQRSELKAQPQLEGYRVTLWQRMTRRTRGAYDSVVGVPEEDGGALRAPEYVIYDPRQARVDYVFEVIAKY